MAFPIITREAQAEFEHRIEGTATQNQVPCICGYCGRACRQMEKEEGANRFICTYCPLAAFAEERARYVGLN